MIPLTYGYPVVGELEPYAGGPFGHFETTNVHGLARVCGDRIDFLAINSQPSGCGHFNAFLAQCKDAYATIGVWSLLNYDFAEALIRRGFTWTTGVIPPDLPEQMLLWRDR